MKHKATTPNVLRFTTIGALLVVTAGCIVQSEPSRRSDTLSVSANPSATVDGRELVRAPHCAGQPAPEPSLQFAGSYVDFVQHAGRSFALANPQPQKFTSGGSLGQVLCTFDDGRAPAGYTAKDGDASRLPVGTALKQAVDEGGMRGLTADTPAGPRFYVLQPG